MIKNRSEIASRLIWGFFLIALGAMLLAVNLGLDVPKSVWNYWPFLLLAMGAARMLFAGDSESRGGGFWLILAGLYGWISIWNLWGLTWGTAWPIFVIAGGISVLLKPAFLRHAGRPGGSDTTLPGGADHVG